MEVLILLAAVGVLLFLERFKRLRFEPLPLLRRHFGSDIFYMLTSGILLSIVARDLAARTLAPASSFTVSALLVVFSFVLFDLGAYLSHRLLHRSDLLWEVHKVHHSSRKLDWLATFRGHLLEHVVRQIFSPVLLIALGVPVLTVGLVAAAHGAWSAFIHSNFRPRLRFLDAILITPRLHRVHHVSATCERNFGAVFTVWDRLGGTLLTKAENGAMGVPDEIDSYPQTWGAQLLEPVRRWRSRHAVLNAPVTR